MGRFTIVEDPDADLVVKEVLDIVVQGVVDLMGNRIQAIVLIGGYGRGEGGVYNTSNGYKLVNDLDLAVFVKKNFRNIKREYDNQLKKLAENLQPRARGIKQIDINITNTLRYRFVPKLVNYYEIKNGHQVLYGDLNLKAVMPKLSQEKLPVFDGSIYFYSRGSGLLLPAIYFLTNNLDKKEVRTNYEIELQKACQAMGDALLLMLGQYHYYYQERLRHFKAIRDSKNLIPEILLSKLSPLYIQAVENKLKPSFNWRGDRAMIERWFEIRNLFGDFFLWFESCRLKKLFESWQEYSDFIFRKGVKEPGDVRFYKVLKNLRMSTLFLKAEDQKSKTIVKKSKISLLLPVMPLLLFGLSKEQKNGDGWLKDAWHKLNGSNDFADQLTWLDVTKSYLSKFHPGGVVEQALRM